MRARAEGSLRTTARVSGVQTFHEDIATLKRPNKCAHGSPRSALILVFLLLDKLSRASEHQAEVLRECK